MVLTGYEDICLGMHPFVRFVADSENTRRNAIMVMYMYMTMH